MKEVVSILSSIVINKIIRSVNEGKRWDESKQMSSEERKFLGNLLAEKEKHPGIYFDLVEPDEDEESELMKLLPDE